MNARWLGVVAGAYFLGGLLLSSVDLQYVWYAPIVSAAGEATPWYTSLGLSRGVFAFANDENLATGVHASLHAPQFFPLPFGAVVGPEGGALLVSVWFVALLSCGLHMAIRRRRESRSSVASRRG